MLISVRFLFGSILAQWFRFAEPSQKLHTTNTKRNKKINEVLYDGGETHRAWESAYMRGWLAMNGGVEESNARSPHSILWGIFDVFLYRHRIAKPTYLL